MMKKEETVEKLKKSGHDVELDKMTILFHVDHVPKKKEQKEMEQIMKDVGYNASWGWRVVRNANGEN